MYNSSYVTSTTYQKSRMAGHFGFEHEGWILEIRYVNIIQIQFLIFLNSRIDKNIRSKYSLHFSKNIDYLCKIHIFWEGHKSLWNLHLTSYIVPVKSKVEISQNFVAFSEYMNFKFSAP